LKAKKIEVFKSIQLGESLDYV